MKHINRTFRSPLAVLILTIATVVSSYGQKKAPIIIEEQGSFAVGGTVITNPGTFDHIKRTPEGQTFHGDHAYVFYQVPAKAKSFR